MHGWFHLGLLVIRMGMGGMFLFIHGGPKLLGGPDVWEQVGGAMAQVGVTFSPVTWGLLAALAEGVGGLCVLLGVFMRPAAGVMAFTMLIAATKHLTEGDGLQVASHALEAGAVFLGLLMTGPGRYHLGRLFQRGSAR